MIELYACFGMWLGICGHIDQVQFQNDAQCKEALVLIQKAKGLTYAYCRPPQRRSGEQ